MDKLVIRKFQKEDLSQVLEMVRALVRLHRDLDAFYRLSEEMTDLSKSVKSWLGMRRGLVLVAEEGGKIIGFIRGSIEGPPYYACDDEVIAKLDDLFIKNQYRNRGLGRRLVLDLFDWFKKKKATVVMLNVAARNESAIKFWEKMGFDRFTLRMKKSLADLLYLK